MHSGVRDDLGGRHLHALGTRHSTHALRHRFAAEVYRATRDLRMVQQLLGHASPTTTAIYTAVDDAATVAAVSSLGPSSR